MHRSVPAMASSKPVVRPENIAAVCFYLAIYYYESALRRETALPTCRSGQGGLRKQMWSNESFGNQAESVALPMRRAFYFKD